MKGHCYWQFRFSINEGEFPNIHVKKDRDGWFCYLAFSHRYKWSWSRSGRRYLGVSA